MAGSPPPLWLNLCPITADQFKRGEKQTVVDASPLRPDTLQNDNPGISSRGGKTVARKLITLGLAIMLGASARLSIATESSASRATVTLTDNDIAQMVKAGLSLKIIIAKIQSAPCNFDTSPSALEGLKSAGVPDEVILQMVNSPVRNVPKAQPPDPDPAESTPEQGGTTEAAARQAETTSPLPTSRSLWVARFTGQPKAAAAIASVEQGDVAVLQQSGLFKIVASFSSQPEQPNGTWVLSAKEISYSGGSTANRVMIGFGAGRSHIVMKYELQNPSSSMVWTKTIKSEPSFWASGGTIGGMQNQSASSDKQAQKLLNALSEFLASQ
jgi:hypothetical protein